MVASYKEDNKRLAKNTIALYFRTAIVMVVSLYVSRILLKVLGVDDFGIYNVVGSIVVLFSFLNTAMTSASQRFITYSISHDGLEETQKVFSASLIIQFFFALILVALVEICGSWFVNTKLSIPHERLFAAKVAFQFSIATFCINMLRVPYESSVIANEKMTFFAYASIIDAILKFSIVLLLQILSVDKLIVYASLLTLEAIIMFCVYFIYCRWKFEICVLRMVRNSNLYKKLLSFSGWNLLGSSTNVGTQNGFIILLNIFCGVSVNAAMSIANQVNGAIGSFIGSFQTSYKPQIVKAYAQGDIKHLNDLVISTSKISFSLMVVPILILIVNMPLVLEIWLVNVPRFTVEFCQLILVCSLIDSISGSYNAAILASGKIKYYEIFISCSFLLDLVISYLLLHFGALPYWGLLSRILTRGIINMIIGLLFLKKILSFSIKEYMKQCLIPILILLICCVPLQCLLRLNLDKWYLLGVSFVTVIISVAILLPLLLLNKSERSFFINVVKTKVSKLW